MSRQGKTQPITAQQLAEMWIDQHPFGEAIVVSNCFKENWVIDDITVGIAFDESSCFADQFQGIYKAYVLVAVEGTPWCSLPTEVWVAFEALTVGRNSMLVHTEKADTNED